jgi:TRAP-type C4-dicarboxylate transport system permease small subunit
MLIPATMFIGLVALLLGAFIYMPRQLAFLSMGGPPIQYLVQLGLLMLIMVGMLFLSLMALTKALRARHGEGIIMENKSEMVM